MSTKVKRKSITNSKRQSCLPKSRESPIEPTPEPSSKKQRPTEYITTVLSDNSVPQHDKDTDENVMSDDELKEDTVTSEDEDDNKQTDAFKSHYECDISQEQYEAAMGSEWTKQHRTDDHLGQYTWSHPSNSVHPLTSSLHIKPILRERLEVVNKPIKSQNKAEGSKPGCQSLAVTDFQQKILHIITQYQDMYYPNRAMANEDDIIVCYCLHAVNHILKTRNKVMAHNGKIKSKLNSHEEYRDQGLTRPKVLFVVPLRESARRIVEVMTRLLMPKEKEYVGNKTRFYKEYSRENEDDWKKGKKPGDYERTFKGNIDDHFRIGIKLAKKSLKLYTEFYDSDVIIASPLGLRTLIGTEGESGHDYDFLSSIEVLVMDQADIFLMQNWEHIWYLMKYIHTQPKESHGVDFSRVRMWTLNGWSKAYRQTLVFSSVFSPEINSLFNKHCHNYSGKVCVQRPMTSGSMSQITTQLPHVFYKLPDCSHHQGADTRFQFFVDKMYPEHKSSLMSQTLIFVPSYFDYVRIRNFFNKEEVKCSFLCEYTTDKNIPASRRLFVNGKSHFMLYTERMHFYRRYKLRGIKHILFYELPLYPHFYSELCNMFESSNTKNATCSVLYSQYDARKLAEIVGQDRTSQLLASSKSMHMFVTGDE